VGFFDWFYPAPPDVNIICTLPRNHYQINREAKRLLRSDEQQSISFLLSHNFGTGNFTHQGRFGFDFELPISSRGTSAPLFGRISSNLPHFTPELELQRDGTNVRFTQQNVAISHIGFVPGKQHWPQVSWMVMFNNGKRALQHIEVASRFKAKSLVKEGLVTLHYTSPNFTSDSEVGFGRVDWDFVYHVNKEVTVGSEVAVNLLNPLRPDLNTPHDNQFSSLFALSFVRIAANYSLNGVSTTCGIDFRHGVIRPRLSIQQRLTRGSIAIEIAQTFGGPVIGLKFGVY